MSIRKRRKEAAKVPDPEKETALDVQTKRILDSFDERTTRIVDSFDEVVKRMNAETLRLQRVARRLEKNA